MSAEDELPAPRDAAVGEEAPEEDDEVRDQTGDRTGFLLATGDNQPGDEQRVDQERRPQADQDPLPHVHPSQGYGASVAGPLCRSLTVALPSPTRERHTG